MKYWLPIRCWHSLWGGVVAGLLTVLPLRAEDSLQWRPEENKVDAEIGAWNLRELLEHITAATGWQVFVEPKTERTISAKFRDISAGDALGKLLGNLNFALLPQSNAPAKLFVFRTTAEEATQLIRAPVRARRGSGTDKPIPNELVVTLKAGASQSIDGLAKRLGAKVVGRIDALHAYRLKFDDDDAANAARQELLANQDVTSIDSNYWMERPVAGELLAASSGLPFSLKPTVSTDSSRVVVGLIDTPTQPLGPRYDGFILPSLAVAGDANPPANQPAHGSSMAETILRGLAIGVENGSGTTPVRILPVDVYGNNASTTTFNVAWGISEAINAGATIINLSLGSQGNSTVLETIIKNAHEQGVLFFAAAGNQPTSAPTYPAAYSEVVAVTAGDKKGNLAPYANYGSFVDVVGPGTSIVYFNNRAYMVTGTSSATAYISGLAAGLATATGRSPTQVEAQLRRSFSFKPTP